MAKENTVSGRGEKSSVHYLCASWVKSSSDSSSSWLILARGTTGVSISLSPTPGIPFAKSSC